MELISIIKYFNPEDFNLCYIIINLNCLAVYWTDSIASSDIPLSPCELFASIICQEWAKI